MRLVSYAWLVVALLLPVAALNYLDRQLLAAMKYSVMSDIPDILTESNWGLMLGQFKWVYAVLSPIGGFIADRLSRRYTITGSLFAWSAVTYLTGQATSFQDLLLARTLMGLSEAFYIPAALALITDYHSGPTRSRAVGLHQMAIYLGVILGAFGGYVAEAPNLGWRWAFTACGYVGMIYTFPLFLLLRDTRVADSDQPTRTAWYLALPLLLTNGSFLLLVIYFTGPAMAAWIIRDWMPAVLKKQFDLLQGPAGVYAGVFWQVAAIGGALIGGWIADRWQARTIRGRIFTSAFGVALICPALFGVGNAPTLVVAVTFLVLFGLGWGFYDCNNMPILCQIVRPELRATGYGLMNFVSISCGGFADWFFGWLRDQAVPLNVSFGLFALIAIASIGVVLAIRPRPELSRS